MNTHTVDNDAPIATMSFNYVEKITAALAAAGHMRPNDWTRNLHPDVYSDTVTDDAKRFLVNRALRLIIADVQNECTLNVRYCMVDQGALPRWFELIEATVIPCLVRHNLPHAIN